MVEDEKRKNRRLASTVQVLDREVSLFRNRRQIFVTVVGFKLFNPLLGKPKSIDAPQQNITGSRVGPDEHVEFFIVVDKSIAPKYLVRHRYNHFKVLHKLLETGAFRIPKPTAHAHAHTNVSYAQEADGRATPWQVGGYYNEPPNSVSSDEDSECSDDGSSLATPTSADVPRIRMQRPSAARLQPAVEMIPSLPRRDKRRPSVGMSGFINKISKKLTSTKTADGKPAQKVEGKLEKKAQRLEQETKYRAHICKATDIPEEDLPFFERRAMELEVYLRQLLSIELFADSDVMSAFLQPDHELFIEQPKTSKGPAGSRSRSSSRSRSTASEGSSARRAITQSTFLAPPAAAHSGRISPGGDYILSHTNLAILMGDAVPPTPQPVPTFDAVHSSSLLAPHGGSTRAAYTPQQTPISTPYMSQNLPPQHIALAIAQQYQANAMLSGPLDTPNVSIPAPPKRPSVRVDKKTMVAMLGGKGSQRFTPAHVMMGQPAPQPTKPSEVTSRSPIEDPAAPVEVPARESTTPPALAAATSNPQFQHLIVRPCPSPVPTPRAVSPFTAMFGSVLEGEHFINPNVLAFSSLVIVADEAHRYPTVLGIDAIADHREQRQKERGGSLQANVGRTTSMSSRSNRGTSPVVSDVPTIAFEKSAFAVQNISRNGNFLLLLSALGFNQVPVYSSASVMPQTLPKESHSNRSMTPTALACTPHRGPTTKGVMPHPSVVVASPFPSYYSNCSVDMQLPPSRGITSSRSQPQVDEAGSSPSSGLPSNMSNK
eukprot:GILJ01015208.1.p1 GENE.GILJ01015208.1~~GILJ01015208.1.p1  ORF type:complete len:792 (-),score=59.97 GILJ01015208.1:43-2352(-)